MTIYVVITKDNDGGYRFQLRDGLARTRPMMNSAKEGDPSACRRAATKLFGELAWRTAEQAGLSGQPYVVSVAVLETMPGIW